MNKLIISSLVALGCVASVQAEGVHIDAGAFATYASGMSLKHQATQQDLGGGVEFGVKSLQNSVGVPCRLGLAVAAFPGKDVDGVKNSLTLYQLTGDAYIKTPVDALRLFVGVSINKWRVSAEGPGYDISGTVKGVKLGARAGLEYDLTPKVALNLVYQATELGLATELAPATRTALLPTNPSWIQLGARFQF